MKLHVSLQLKNLYKLLIIFALVNFKNHEYANHVLRLIMHNASTNEIVQKNRSNLFTNEITANGQVFGKVMGSMSSMDPDS